MSQRIGFEHTNILTVNGYLQQTDDTVPDALAMLVKDAQYPIMDKLEHLVREERRLTPSALPSRPTILIARMALLRDIGDVLTYDAISSPDRFFDHYKYLKEPYLYYWAALANGPFAPRVERRGGDEIVQGVWLGVTVPK